MTDTDTLCDKPKQHNANYNTIVFWILGTVTTICLGGGGAWLANIHEQMQEVRSVQNTQIDKTAGLKANQEQLLLWLPRMDSRIEKMNDKLDRIIERQK